GSDRAGRKRTCRPARCGTAADRALAGTERVVSDLTTRLRGVTPARLLLGRNGAALPTGAALALRADHAAARDAVTAELDFAAPPWPDLEAVIVETCATSKSTYLRRPDLGRRLADRSRSEIATRVAAGQDL